MISWLRNTGALAATPFRTVRMFIHLRRHARVLSRSLLPGMMALAVLAMSAEPAEACSGTISGGTLVTGSTAYDPYSAASNVGTYYLKVTNRTGNCRYIVVFRTGSLAPKLGSTLNYTIAASGPSPTLPSNAVWQAAYNITIVPRQFAAPGTYSDGTMYADLYVADSSGNLTNTRSDYKRLDIDYTVNAVMSVNIAGAPINTSTTVHLGTLAKGMQATVGIEARGNQAYQLGITSDHNGVMVLTSGVMGQTWTVPYTATLGGKALNLAAGATIANQPATHPASDASYPLVVTIGEASAKRAGLYQDTITIAISAMKL